MSPQARPPTGLTKADIVYLLPVEGGLSRIFAVFSSHIPPVVGPVRSSREEDIKLLRQFGRPAFAFSGAQPQLLPVVEHARIVDLYAGIVGGYFRGSSRVAPYNLYARTSSCSAEAKGASKARDIGFRFGPAPAGGKPTQRLQRRLTRSAAFSFRWSAAQHRWLVWMDGRPATAAEGGQLGGAHGRGAVHQGPHVGLPRARDQAAVRATLSAAAARSCCATAAPTTCTGRARLPTAAPRSRCPTATGCRSRRGQVWVVYGFGPGSTNRLTSARNVFNDYARIRALAFRPG